MASSKLMASTSPAANPDLARQSPSLHHSSLTHQSKSFGSMSMDDLLRNIYSTDADAFPDPAAAAAADNGVAGGSGGGGGAAPGVGNKTVDEFWKEIVEGNVAGSRGEGDVEMTLEDFLTKAGAVTAEDFQAPPPHMQALQDGGGGYGVDSAGFGNGIDGTMVGVAVGSSSGGGVGRGKRRAVEEPPMDRATQQKQKRMIKNRESAARSRERKQAYTVELETLVTQLEEENSRLLREEAEHSKERFKQLMENLIPVVEKRRPPRSLRRMRSMSW